MCISRTRIFCSEYCTIRCSMCVLCGVHDGVNVWFLYTGACGYLCVMTKRARERVGLTCPCRWELACSFKTRHNSTVHCLCRLSSSVINLPGPRFHKTLYFSLQHDENLTNYTSTFGAITKCVFIAMLIR